MLHSPHPHSHSPWSWWGCENSSSVERCGAIVAWQLYHGKQISLQLWRESLLSNCPTGGNCDESNGCGQGSWESSPQVSVNRSWQSADASDVRTRLCCSLLRFCSLRIHFFIPRYLESLILGVRLLICIESLCRAFQAVDAKSIRVSISSFYDYLTVSLKCIQEFDLGGGEGEVVSGNTDAGE